MKKLDGKKLIKIGVAMFLVGVLMLLGREYLEIRIKNALAQEKVESLKNTVESIRQENTNFKPSLELQRDIVLTEVEKAVTAVKTIEKDPLEEFRKIALEQCNSADRCITNGEVDIMIKVASDYGIPPEYLAIIGLSENILNPTAVGDNGCSFGAYQGNACAGSGRYGEVHFGKDYVSCMKDFDCSSRWTANRIVGKYMPDHRANTNDPRTFLIYHNGHYPGDWYYPKVNKYSDIFGY